MTNKTITFACCTCGKPTACGKMICEECCYEPLPVPPAGGDVETVATMYVALRDDFNSFACLGRPGNGGPLYKEEPLVRQTDHHAQVTRLQAEVERLGKRVEEEVATAISNELKSERDVLALQAELTKALELLKEADNFMYIMTGHDSHARLVHQYGKEWWTPVNELRGKICTALSNQSAPADKGQGEPVAWLYKNTNMGNELSFQRLDHYYRPYTASGEHDYVKGIALYAEPPAPVAVVLPDGCKIVPIEPTELMIHRGDQNYSWSVAKIYKAMIESAPECLDELARLNPIKQ